MQSELKLRLITLYDFLEEKYDTFLQWQCQRFSNNPIKGYFTDTELLTCYLFAIIEEGKFKIRDIYDYIVKYWSSWFPTLPSYQAFNQRLNRLSDSLPLLLGLISKQLMPDRGLICRDLLIDSVPIMLAKGKRKGKIAPEIAANTYSSSKNTYYYGMKVHWMGMAQADKLPHPVWMELTSAAEHDLPPLKEILPHMHNCNLFGDKAYGSQGVKEQLEAQNSKLFCPEKNVKGESVWERQFNAAFRKVYGRAVSSVRQPIESFFNWIIEKTNIQNAAKVRSTKGLLVHIFGKIAAAMLILIGV